MKKYITLAAVAVTAIFLTAADTDTAALKQEISQLRSQNADLTRRLLEASAPPIEVGRRKALTGDGYVIQIGNQSGKTVSAKVHLESPAFNKEADFDLVLSPARITPAIKEIGYKEGWVAAPGDIVTITCPGFNIIKKTLQE